MLKSRVVSFIDFFYPPFRKLMPEQTFRYAACGGANTVLGFLIYTLSFKYLFREKVFDVGFYAFKPHIASLITSFLINFPIGFILMKYIVFVDSTIRGHVQLFRYLFVFIANLFLNYILLKVLVESLYINAITAQVISTIVVVTISYLLQRHFTFRVTKTRLD